MSVRSFLTGSRVYGTPRADSDVDLVVLVGAKDLVFLRALAEKKDLVVGQQESLSTRDAAQDPGDSLRFGKLNLICHTSLEVFEAWRGATDELESRKPVTRDEAVKTIKGHVKDAVAVAERSR